MKGFSILILVVLFAIQTNSAAFSLSNFIQQKNLPDDCLSGNYGICTKCQNGFDLINGECKKEVTLPENCKKASHQGCTLCEDGYDLTDGRCIQKNKVDDSEEAEQVPSGFVPCNGENSCGESQPFETDEQLKNFIEKNTEQEKIVVVEEKTVQSRSSSLNVADYTTTSGQASRSRSSRSSRKASAPTARAQIAFDAAPSASTSVQIQNLDFSGTNNQEQNVDEADLLKTDGGYIYTISNKKLSIIRSYPVNSAQILSTIDLRSFNPKALFIQGDFLAVFGNDHDNYYQSYYRSTYGYIPRNPYTAIRIYSIANRSYPYLLKTFRVEGSYFNGRKTQDGFIYILSTQKLSRRISSPWCDIQGRQVFLGWRRIFRYRGAYKSPIFLNIFSFNLRQALKNEHNMISLITEKSQKLYMSENHIYVSFTKYIRRRDYTVIHKIYVCRTLMVPFADTKVRGVMRNQFWMDQYGPFLRVSTIVTRGVRTRTENRVFCLNYYLKQIGSITGIAPGERIFAARYVNRKLYLVTFRQTDPFYVISFAHHRHPKILGELKINGFSRYLHPYNENVIIGLGRQATARGRPLGLKIALFDVSNVWDPKQIASFELEEKYARSGAEWEHKAFLFSREKNLLVIPGRLRSKQVKFNGAFIFFINETKIELRSIVDHLKSPTDKFAQRTVERNLYIEDYLYSKSKCLLTICSLYNYSRVKEIDIPCDNKPIVNYTPQPHIDPVPIRHAP